MAGYLLMGQRFDRENRHFKFCFMEIATKDEFERTAVEIARDSSLISGLHAQDAFKIGYVLANEVEILGLPNLRANLGSESS